ncbi:hypothetical protein HK105_203947 [Polyrhizophydium stewartii]|uniref:Uncharacterized protein n=1 Tax=Polyrhizophydium stewartii TaxID=2732419 RepID=A0ABR4NAL3_9FUNG
MRAAATLALVAAAASQAAAQVAMIGGSELANWNALKTQADSITYTACATQLDDTWSEANAVLMQFGLSNQFIDSLTTLALVAGDIPEAAAFRTSVANLTSTFKSDLAAANVGTANAPGAAASGNEATAQSLVPGSTESNTDSLVPKAGLVSAAPVAAPAGNSMLVMGAVAAFFAALF